MVKFDKSITFNSSVLISALLVLIPSLVQSVEISSAKKISEIGKQTSSCPFHLSKNEMPGRVPSIFYEIKCLTCHHCDKKSGSKSQQGRSVGHNGSITHVTPSHKCMQLTTKIDTWNATSLEKMEPIHVKVIFTVFLLFKNKTNSISN